MLGNPRLEPILAMVVEWASQDPAIRAVALIGSCARGDVGPASDVDLLILTENPNAYRQTNWLECLDWERPNCLTASYNDAEYGVVWSRHVMLDVGLEIEFSFAPLSWANTMPIDPGTYHVTTNGFRILHDLDDRLKALASKIKLSASPC